MSLSEFTQDLTYWSAVKFILGTLLPLSIGMFLLGRLADKLDSRKK